MEIVNILILSSGLIYAILDDWNGDKHPNNDWISIGIVMLVSSVSVALFSEFRWPFDWGKFGIDIIRGLAMAIGLYVLIFNWAIVYIMVKRGVIQLPLGRKWYNHFSKKAIPDKWLFWNGLPWLPRFAILFFIFICFTLVYVFL